MKAEKFQEFIQLRRAIRIRPKHATDQTLHGFPLLINEHFLLLQEIREFHLDGYAVIPLKNVYAVRSGRAERAIERVLTGEGVYDKVGIPYEVNLTDFATIFRSLQALGKSVIIETLEVEGDMIEESFVIGKITGASKRSVAILNFDDAGYWNAEPTILGYRQVKWITFDSEYINTFTKYVQ